ncbi:MAG: hypothetical protein QOK37_927 [Thermoanaerobaculia bacterium]|jgi:hypothetical protein|nr:hypothetical protein [Thermoanaerobaculia bacterium]
MQPKQNDQVHAFDEEAVNQALDAAREAGDPAQLTAFHAGGGFTDSGRIAISPQCVKVTVANHKVCVSIPKLGTHCLPIPIGVPNGTVGEACLTICTHFGIPTGAKVSVSVAGHVVVSKTFGVC